MATAAVLERLAVAYTSAEIVAAAGCTYRQLDYWARVGYVTPSIREAAGQGSQRLWSADDLDDVRRMTAAAAVFRR